MPPYDKLFIWRCFRMKNKKVVVGIIGILFVAACVIVFAYFRGNAAYVKLKFIQQKNIRRL